MNTLIGTSGYDYPEWKGAFYPENLKRKDFLSYYSTQFNALELNNTFYNMPTAERMKGFYERSEGRLSFSVKANRLLTHETGADWRENAKAFQMAVSPLLEKNSLCTVLFQFPQSFHYTKDNRIYLSNLIEEFKGFPVVIEFRHVDWVRDSVFEGLKERGAEIAYCDMPKLKYLPPSVGSMDSVNSVPVTNSLPAANFMPAANFAGSTSSASSTPAAGGLFYLRLHGRNSDAWYSDSQSGSARYKYNYSDAELSEFLPVIQNIIITGKKPVVFFNNHPNGSGPLNARRLQKMLSAPAI